MKFQNSLTYKSYFFSKQLINAGRKSQEKGERNRKGQKTTVDISLDSCMSMDKNIIFNEFRSAIPIIQRIENINKNMRIMFLFNIELSHFFIYIEFHIF